MRKLFWVPLLLVVGCNDHTLQPLEKLYNATLGYIEVDAHFCTSPPQVLREKVKYLFILDHSGSNQAGFPLVAGDVSSTDPTGSRRYGPLIQFVNSTPPDPNALTYFSLIDFADAATVPNGFADPTNTDAVFSNSISTVVQNATADWTAVSKNPPQPKDGGFTNYIEALAAAERAVRDDALNEAANPVKPLLTSSYQIIFVSDGIPIVPSGAPGSGQVINQGDSAHINQIQSGIQAILDLKSDPVVGPYIDNVVLNTAYYYNTSQVAGAAQLLAQMAVWGNGKAEVFGAGQNILYQVFAIPVRNVKYNLADVFLENENAVWWDDGRLLLDSDGDGLPDLIESKLGSNPFLKDSDGNGVSDLVEYRTTGKPCNDLTCNAVGRNSYSVCDGFSPSNNSGIVTFPDSDNDGLNDCEEFILGSNRYGFDSNSDFIPDSLAFKSTLPFIDGTDGSQASPNSDGVTNYMKLKQGLPISVSAKSILNFKKRVTQFDHESSQSDGTECYHIDVTNFAIMGLNNSIKIYVIENNSVIDNKPVLKTAERTLSGAQSLIQFTTGDFQ